MGKVFKIYKLSISKKPKRGFGEVVGEREKFELSETFGEYDTFEEAEMELDKRKSPFNQKYTILPVYKRKYKINKK